MLVVVAVTTTKLPAPCFDIAVIRQGCTARAVLRASTARGGAARICPSLLSCALWRSPIHHHSLTRCFCEKHRAPLFTRPRHTPHEFGQRTLVRIIIMNNNNKSICSFVFRSASCWASPTRSPRCPACAATTSCVIIISVF